MKGAAETSYIYLIGSDSGPYKIGVGENPKARLTAIQTGNHVKLTVVFAVEIASENVFLVEKRVHAALRSKRLSGEWFDVSPCEARSAIADAVIFIEEDPPDECANEAQYALIRKSVEIPSLLWESVSEFRYEQKLRTERQAITRLIEAGLEAMQEDASLGEERTP